MPVSVGRERWVFGYGSLMWRPGFEHVERRPAVLHGRRRAFCIYSVHHRGRPERPGLVLGLVPGGSVRGMAFRVPEEAWPRAHAYLIDREQPTETYVEAYAPVRLEGGGMVEALVFLSDRSHPQWAGDLSLEQQAERIARADGLSGRNVDYLADLVSHLRASGSPDPTMERLLGEVMVRLPEPYRTAA